MRRVFIGEGVGAAHGDRQIPGRVFAQLAGIARQLRCASHDERSGGNEHKGGTI